MISAIDRLRALRAGEVLDTSQLTGIEDLPMEWRIDYEERAAILEYDGGLSREKADTQALQEIIERLRPLENSQGAIQL